MKNLNNIVVINETEETGKEIIELFKEHGINVSSLMGDSCIQSGCTHLFYGLINNEIDCWSMQEVVKANAKIFTLQQFKEYLSEEDKLTFPREMIVSHYEDFSHSTVMTAVCKTEKGFFVIYAVDEPNFNEGLCTQCAFYKYAKEIPPIQTMTIEEAEKKFNVKIKV